jgi:hypothetical protein
LAVLGWVRAVFLLIEQPEGRTSSYVFSAVST